MVMIHIAWKEGRSVEQQVSLTIELLGRGQEGLCYVISISYNISVGSWADFGGAWRQTWEVLAFVFANGRP